MAKDGNTLFAKSPWQSTKDMDNMGAERYRSAEKGPGHQAHHLTENIGATLSRFLHKTSGISSQTCRTREE